MMVSVVCVRTRVHACIRACMCVRSSVPFWYVYRNVRLGALDFVLIIITDIMEYDDNDYNKNPRTFYLLCYAFDICLEAVAEHFTVSFSFLFEPTLTMTHWLTDSYLARKQVCPSCKAMFLKWSAQLMRTGGKWVTLSFWFLTYMGGGGGSCIFLFAASPVTKGSDGFFLTCQDFGRMFNNSFPACAFFFLKVEISSRTLIPLIRPGSVHSGSASWDDCDSVFSDELHVSSFPDRFQHYAWIVA